MIDEKVVAEKLEKNEPLTPEEEKWFLTDEPAAEGYKPPLEGTKAVTVEPAKEEVKDAEEKAKEEPAVEKKEEPAKEDVFTRLERELQKPEGQEAIGDWSAAEKAYFHQMKRDRKARQKAEAERDALLFEKTKKKEEPKEEVDPLKDLNGRADDDFVSVADVKKILSKKETPKEQPREEHQQVDPRMVKYLQMCDKEARDAHPDDYEAVMELTNEILNTNKNHLVEVAEAMKRGENPAEVSYRLIKNDPEFQKLYPVAETKVKARKPIEKQEPPPKTPEAVKKETEAKKAEEAIERNKSKTKTTAHVASLDDKPSDELSMEDITKMTDSQFAKLPKKTREKYLRLYG